MPNLKRPGDSSLSRFSSISSFSHRRRRLAGQSKTTKFSAGINWSLNQIIKSTEMAKMAKYYQHMSAPWDFIKFNFAKNWQWKSSNDLPFRLQNSYCPCLTWFLPFFLLSVSGFDGWALHMRAGHMPTGKVTVNPARQSQTPGFHPKPQLLPKDIKIFHTLQIISEMPDLKRPLRFKLFQIFQHLQLSPPAETPGVVNLRPPGFQPESTGVSIR